VPCGNLCDPMVVSVVLIPFRSVGSCVGLCAFCRCLLRAMSQRRSAGTATLTLESATTTHGHAVHTRQVGGAAATLLLLHGIGSFHTASVGFKGGDGNCTVHFLQRRVLYVPAGCFERVRSLIVRCAPLRYACRLRGRKQRTIVATERRRVCGRAAGRKTLPNPAARLTAAAFVPSER
jgi:hypothetical protein